jgi:hypothetical protein
MKKKIGGIGNDSNELTGRNMMDFSVTLYVLGWVCSCRACCEDMIHGLSTPVQFVVDERLTISFKRHGITSLV